MKKPNTPHPRKQTLKTKTRHNTMSGAAGCPICALSYKLKKCMYKYVYIYVCMKEVLQERSDLDQDPEVVCDCFGRLF